MIEVEFSGRRHRENLSDKGSANLLGSSGVLSELCDIRLI